jgi:hypothetical protein
VEVVQKKIEKFAGKGLREQVKEQRQIGVVVGEVVFSNFKMSVLARTSERCPAIGGCGVWISSS